MNEVELGHTGLEVDDEMAYLEGHYTPHPALWLH